MRRYNYRTNRVTYAVYLAIFVIAYAVMVIAMKRPPALAEVLVAFVAIPRLHDIGRSGWWLLILLGAELGAIAIGWRGGVDGVLLASGLVVFAALGALIVSTVLLAACNTTKGAGTDLKAAGTGIENSADRHGAK